MTTLNTGTPAGVDETVAKFLAQLVTAVQNEELQKLVLSKYQGPESEWQRIQIRPVMIKSALLLQFVWQNRTFDQTKNFTLEDAVLQLQQWLGHCFFSAHLQSQQREWQLSYSKKGKVLLSQHKKATAADHASSQDAPLKNAAAQSLSHNNSKQRYVEQDRPYLSALGITDAQGQLVPSMSKKWKQINKFIETLAAALQQTQLAAKPQLHIADFGSGKAYLTFAVYDYLTHVLQFDVKVTGVELRQPLVDLCNQLAVKVGFSGLQFQQGDVQHFQAQAIDVMIALHACDTATDYAIHMGIRTQASIIMCSPCCHKQLRPQVQTPKVLAPLLQHGIHLGQEAEMLTDGLRALWLEAYGYDTQVFEFIGLEHTSKNKMILAQRRKKPRDPAAIFEQIAQLKAFYGIQEHCLEQLLSKN